MNGRYYASIGFSVAIGLNLPAIWAAAATGRPLPPHREPHREARYLWFQGDLLRALSARGRRMTEVIDVLRCRRHSVHSLWRPDDPWPAIRFLAHMPTRLFERRRAKLVPTSGVVPLIAADKPASNPEPIPRQPTA